MTVVTVREHFPETTLKLRRMIAETWCWAQVQQGKHARASWEKCLYLQLRLIRLTRPERPQDVPHMANRAAEFADAAGLHRLAIHLHTGQIWQSTKTRQITS